MAIQRDPLDPKGLIREAYRIDGISQEECRSVFLDWALSHADAPDPQTAIAALIERYGTANPDHPMNAVLQEGLGETVMPRRRGGWRSRRRED